MIRRGDIFWVGFGNPRGSEPAKVRPAVIVQAGWVLDTALNTVSVVPLTSNLDHQRFPGNVLIPMDSAGLGKDSVALVTQLSTISREFLEPYPVGALPRYLLDQVDAGVRLVLDV